MRSLSIAAVAFAALLSACSREKADPSTSAPATAQFELIGFLPEHIPVSSSSAKQKTRIGKLQVFGIDAGFFQRIQK